MIGRSLAIVVVLALVAGVVYRVQTQEDVGAMRNGPGGAGGEARALAVKTVPVVVRDFPRVIELPATLEAARQTAISAQVGAVLMQQHVQEGDSVRAGQLLFSLDARTAATRIAQSQASLTGAQAEMADAETRLQRLKPLMKSGYISQQEFDAAVVAREAARAKSSTARAELDAARLDVGYANIRAPFAGRVGRITVRPGDLVAAGTALTTLMAAGGLDARASVAQQDWPALAAARARGPVRAEIFHDADTTPLAQGELVFVDSQLNADSGAVPIKVRLTGAPPALISGQSVRLRLQLGVETDARVVPEAALQHAQEGTYVYVVRDGKAVTQPVTLLRALDGEQAVSGELRAGEPVLIEIPQRLKAGGAVRLEGERPGGSGARAVQPASASRP
jgi:RND family efflux transporter MFP subunit